MPKKKKITKVLTKTVVYEIPEALVRKAFDIPDEEVIVNYGWKKKYFDTNKNMSRLDLHVETEMKAQKES